MKGVGFLIEDVRLGLMDRALGLRDMTPEELAEESGLGLEEVHAILAKMIEVDLVESVEGRTKNDPIGGRYRYRFDKGILTDAIDLSIAERQSLAYTVSDYLERELRESFEGIATVRPEVVAVRIPMSVDEKGWREVSGLLEDAMREVIAKIEESRDRLRARAGGSGARWGDRSAGGGDSSCGRPSRPSGRCCGRPRPRCRRWSRRRRW